MPFADHFSYQRRWYDPSSNLPQVLFLDDDDDALTRDEPTTPRRTIASRLVPDALMEVNETKPKCKNSNVGTLVKTGESLGEGQKVLTFVSCHV